ncbi:hypothetical protein HMPREF0004_4016 [Achromobacter piechaudii ATCC 43553]|uniref:Uncharacterized protein n=1 Tax=Achromobacter piechaudii ATCC 43553 TaxID=742159 RepID=D4XEW9_9BURK|nr:hypothetical protein HMPREF0004_4016 [Achromobacter piechaudii ATCC 43553]
MATYVPVEDDVYQDIAFLPYIVECRVLSVMPAPRTETAGPCFGFPLAAQMIAHVADRRSNSHKGAEDFDEGLQGYFDHRGRYPLMSENHSITPAMLGKTV